MPKKKPATEETVRSAGKGKKICPKCSVELGARTMICNCGHEFTPKTQTRRKVSTSLQDQLEERLAEIDMILASKESLELEQERIQSLLEAIR